MQTIDKQPDREVQSLYFLRDIRTYAAQLRASHFGPYSEPQKLLLLTQWEDSSVADEIAASTPSEQRFVCPVDILWEVTTTIAIVTPATVAPLRLSLCEGTRRGARVISRRWLPDASWISVNLDAPLAGCTNGVLKLRVESRPPRSTGVSSWMYAPYFDGEFRHGGTLVPSRAVSLALNGFHFAELP